MASASRFPTTGGTRGFSLIELLVVVSIIAVLTGLSLSAMTSVREGGRRAVCLSKVRQMGMAVLAYCNDNEGFMPTSSGWNSAFRGYWAGAGPQFKLVLDYLERDVADKAWRKRFFICPSNVHYDLPEYVDDITYAYSPSAPIDLPMTLSQMLASAQRRRGQPMDQMPLPSNQFALFWDNAGLWDYGQGGGFSTRCNHKRRAGLFAGNDSGTPAGSNVGLSDGAVVWAPYLGDAPTNPAEFAGEKVYMVLNGGSIGGQSAIPNNMVWFRIGGDGTLDTTRWDNYIVGLRNMNIAEF